MAVMGASMNAEETAANSRAMSDALKAKREHPTRGDGLIKVLNAHGAMVCDIESGRTGLVNPRNAGVKMMLGSMLIPCDATDEQSVAARVGVDRDAEIKALREALSRAEAESEERFTRINALEARVRELQHEMVGALAHRERIAELEALVASQRAEMEALTALTAPSVAPSQNTPAKAPDSPSKAPNRNR